MGLTSLSVVLAVILLNIHLYGTALKPVPRRLRIILFKHVAAFLRVRLHRAKVSNEKKSTRRNLPIELNRLTQIQNGTTSNQNEIPSNSQMTNEYRRFLADMNRLLFNPNDNSEEEKIIRDWQNVALVMDRCLFYLYIFFTSTLTIITLLIAPLLKKIPEPPNYFYLNITRE